MLCICPPTPHWRGTGALSVMKGATNTNVQPIVRSFTFCVSPLSPLVQDNNNFNKIIISLQTTLTQRCTFISDSIMILIIHKICSPSHGNNHSDLAKALGRGQSPSAWKPSLRSPCLATGETWSSAEQCDRGRLALCGHVNSSSSACACVRTYVCARADFNTKVLREDETGKSNKKQKKD